MSNASQSVFLSEWTPPNLDEIRDEVFQFTAGEEAIINDIEVPQELITPVFFNFMEAAARVNSELAEAAEAEAPAAEVEASAAAAESDNEVTQGITTDEESTSDEESTTDEESTQEGDIEEEGDNEEVAPPPSPSLSELAPSLSDEAIGNIILEGLNGTLGGGPSVNEGAEGAGDSVINGASDISGNNISPNPSGESEAIPFVNLVPVQKEYSCCVCWGNLDMENSVSTLCNHFYCKKCFFRWIEVSATCALCRTPLDTKSHLTEEQFMRENSECYQRYKEILITNARLSSKNLKLIRKQSNLKLSVDALFQQQIRLRNMIDKTRGCNDGSLAARDKILGGLGRKDKRWAGMFGNNHWTWGFNIEYTRTKVELREKLKAMDKTRTRRIAQESRFDVGLKKRKLRKTPSFKFITEEVMEQLNVASDNLKLN